MLIAYLTLAILALCIILLALPTVIAKSKK